MASSDIQFSWDEQKNLKNQKKHGISFETAIRVFSDPFHITVQDREVEGEPRWQTIGTIESLQVLLVAHTDVEDEEVEVIRVISARKATRAERKIYGKQIANR